jgi:hypothetical protein
VEVAVVYFKILLGIHLRKIPKASGYNRPLSLRGWIGQCSIAFEESGILHGTYSKFQVFLSHMSSCYTCEWD